MLMKLDSQNQEAKLSMGNIGSTGIITTNDIDHCQEIVDPWKVELRQLSSGKFDSKVEYVMVDDIMFYREHWTQKILGRGHSPEGYYVISGPIDDNQTYNWNGVTVQKSKLLCENGEREGHFLTTPGESHIIIMVPNQTLTYYLGEEAKALLDDHNFIEAKDSITSKYITHLNNLVTKYHARPEVLDYSGVIKTLKLDLLQDLSGLIPPSPSDKDMPKYTKRRNLLLDALDIIAADDGFINVPMLAQNLEVSQRTIELIIKEALGVTPNTLIRTFRMHRVFHDLQHADPEDQHRVSEIALKYGFTELGRFTQYYKNMFSELPSQTLRTRRKVVSPLFKDVLLANKR